MMTPLVLEVREPKACEGQLPAVGPARASPHLGQARWHCVQHHSPHRRQHGQQDPATLQTFLNEFYSLNVQYYEGKFTGIWALILNYGFVKEMTRWKVF
ncbi:hypothetical protein N7510_009731 [Penicillium lagena]|uniref:uncharacterized protein n=1 Tax=Penicillium lagena TaxID=94218 RepID=UPI00254027EF|nr:uncharacterized protein N7510_009731 [Penicillium lagena]KAJ5604577.1 hypothetical protein N7510_009731 [Penicillium lagena]